MADEIINSGAEVPLESPSVPSAIEPSPTDSGDGGQPKKLSLKEELTKNFNDLREPKELRSKEPAEKPAVKADATGKLHAPDGKFVPKDPNKAVEAKSAPVATATKTDAPPATASIPSGPPPGWSPESKAFFNSLPPDHPIRMDVAKRETEISDGFKKYSDDAKRYTEIEQVLAPARSTYQRAGVQSDAEAINRLLTWEAQIRNNPAQAIPALARQYGLDLASIAQNPGSHQPPQDASITQQLQQLVQQAVQPVQSEMQRIQTERAASEIAQFSTGKDYFEKVKATMGKLMAQGAATDLNQAYQMATWNDPEIRAELIQKELDGKLAANQQAQQEQVQRSQSARKAAISPSNRAPAPPALNGKEKVKGVRGSILAAVNELREERA